LYSEHRTRLADELGADPSAELQRLHLAILQGTATVAAPRTNLPAARTSFLGRDDDLRRVRELVGGSRLVTLTGPGGSGKTRLAIESARGLAESFPDGVWLVELAPVTKPEDVAPAVAAAVGALESKVRNQSPLFEAGDVEQRLVGVLAPHQALVVLDNCEHLIDAAAYVADLLLSACPRVRVLATSREPVGITGEALWPVEPLTLPPADADVATALTYPVVQLLRERAVAVRPDFEVDEAAVRICRALDGMPLAIELAAARLRTMPAAQLAERLDDKFRLLRGGSRTALPRHQTLRAVIDWSWDLLDADERRAWSRLAIATSTIGLDLAESLLGPDAVELTAALVDKSLLRPDGRRWRMLETVREYGLERLAESGEDDEAHKAWVEHFIALTETAEPHLRGRDQLVWMRRLADDHENIQSVIRWTIARGWKEQALRLIIGVGWYWWLRGFRREGGSVIEAALALPGEAPHYLLAMGKVFAAVSDIDAMDDLERSFAVLTEAVELARGEEHRHPMLRMAAPMRALMESGIKGEPEPLDFLERYFDDPDPWLAATAHAFHGHAAMNMGGDRQMMRADFENALVRFRDVGDRWGIILVLDALAAVAGQEGDFAAGAAYARDAVALAEELEVTEDAVQQRMNLAWALWHQGRRDDARAMIDDAARVAAEINLPHTLTFVAYGRANMDRLDGALDAARRGLERCLAELQELLGAPQFRAMMSSALAMLVTVQGDLDRARILHTSALEDGLTVGDHPVVGLALIGWADYALARGDAEKAAALLGAAQNIAGGIDHSVPDRPRIEAAALAALGTDRYAEAYEKGREWHVKNVRTLTATLA
ncbi:MAG: AfsR/SARP family transcriptional regulator, partial [Catenulispora sp.]|nr:AfsR/SARP family transcriptional regulator [Catenulispora sp.]